MPNVDCDSINDAALFETMLLFSMSLSSMFKPGNKDINKNSAHLSDQVLSQARPLQAAQGFGEST